MKKSFKSGFDDLLLGTQLNTHDKPGLSEGKNEAYIRTTLSIKSELLEKIKVRCILDKKKLKDFVNEAFEKYLSDLETK